MALKGMLQFLKAQVSSLIASLLDFVLTVLLVESLGVWYGLASVLGNIGGAITNFMIGRFWTFEAADKSPKQQAWKYALVWLGYVILNFGLLVLVKDFLRVDYRIAKIAVAILLSVTYNYLLQKSFVFK
jgi:putative flippase GtrA